MVYTLKLVTPARTVAKRQTIMMHEICAWLRALFARIILFVKT